MRAHKERPRKSLDHFSASLRGRMDADRVPVLDVLYVVPSRKDEVMSLRFTLSR